MSRISDSFKHAENEKRALLIPYLTAGFPSLKSSEDIFRTLANEGAGMIEIGIPFSDPMADGPTIQRASETALAQGVTTEDVFMLIRNLRETTNVPLVVMTYYNLFFKYGLKRFVEEGTAAGLDGVIIPDLPPEEADDWLKVARGKLDTVFLLAPTSSAERIGRIVECSEGFIYCVSLTGVTGVRDALPHTLSHFVARVRARTQKPIAVGFGVSSSEQARGVARLADGVIIGSAFINAVSRRDDKKGQIEEVRAFLHQILPALQK